MSGGHRLRLDELVVVLIKHVVRFLLARRQLQRQLEIQKLQRHVQYTGSAPTQSPAEIPLAFYQPDEAKDARAQALLSADKVISVEWCMPMLTAKVLSDNLFRVEPYICRLLPWSEILCTCVNFESVGGYCKHLRAALLKVWYNPSGKTSLLWCLLYLRL